MSGRIGRWRYGIAIASLVASAGTAAVSSYPARDAGPAAICPSEVVWAAERARRSREGGTEGLCGTQGPCDEPWTRDATQRSPLSLRLVVHVMCGESGEAPGGVDEAAVDQQIRQLNRDFAAAGISFRSTTRFHADAEFHSLPAYHPSRTSWRAAITAMKEAYAEDPERRINVFVSRQEESRYGTLLGLGTFPWDPGALTARGGVWINADHFGADRHTLTHEMGHALGLWHTHHGVTEAGACDESCYEGVHDATDAAADRAGDLCGDTPATPVNYRCAEAVGTDCAGRAWTAHGPTDYANYMGAAPDGCADHFTPQQRARMHCWVRNALASVLEEHDTPAPATPLIADAALESHPNPFNPVTRLRVSLPLAATVSLRVYDVSGRLVATLAEGKRDAGVFEVPWDGRSRSGGFAASGVYYARLVAGDVVRTRRIVFVK